MIIVNLYANGVRILRPNEATQLIATIPKEDNKCKFEVLLYTGARYSEIKALYDNPRWFNGVSIDMPNTKFLVKKKVKSRNIRLNPKGQRAVNQYLYRCKTGLPHYSNWRNDLKRWFKLAGLDSDGVGIRTTRKTYESWLVIKYESKVLHILSSMGHSQSTALQHYLNLGFTPEDISQMNPYTEGWI